MPSGPNALFTLSNDNCSLTSLKVISIWFRGFIVDVRKGRSAGSDFPKDSLERLVRCTVYPDRVDNRGRIVQCRCPVLATIHGVWPMTSFAQCRDDTHAVIQVHSSVICRE